MKTIVSLIFIALVALSGCDSPQKSKENETSGNEKPKKEEVNVPGFDADSAFKFVKAQTDFGPRVPNSEAHQKCASYLENTMKRFADTVRVQQAKVRAYNNDILNISNIISSFNPDKKKRVLLCAHWDSRPYADHDENEDYHREPISGANDGASGVGALIEIARQMKNMPPDVGVDIIFFDAEDYGPPQSMQSNKQDTWGLGSQYWARNPHRFGYKANYGILLDMVGAANARFPKEQFSRYYASHIVDKVWTMASRLGYDNYFVDERGGMINDDHYYINEIIGIPTINIIHLNPDSKNGSFFEHWHTREDTIDKISPETLRVVGDVVLNVVYRE
ncbi:MAG: M28 family peptidase [Bacteroidota bacterium]